MRFVFLILFICLPFFASAEGTKLKSISFRYNKFSYKAECRNAKITFSIKIKNKWKRVTKPRINNQSLRKKIKLISISCAIKSTNVIVIPTATSTPQPPTPTSTPGPLSISVINKIDSLLPDAENYLKENIQIALRSNNPQVLYNSQHNLKSLLKTGAKLNRTPWLDSIGRVLKSALVNELDGSPFLSTVTSNPSYRAWMNSTQQEVILYSSQWLTLAADYLWETKSSTSPIAVEMRNAYSSILHQHLERWIYNSKPFQRSGWGCAMTNNLSHWEVIRALYNNNFIGDGTLSYCDTVLEPEYFILKIGVLYLDLQEMYPSLFTDIISSTPTSEMPAFRDYLLESAKVYVDAFQRNTDLSISFNFPLWIDHPTMKYGNLTSDLQDNADLPTSDLFRAGGSDISHESRHIFVLNAIQKAQNSTALTIRQLVQPILSSDPLKVFGEGILHGVYTDQSSSLPIRGNYLEGNDGWYLLKQEAGYITGHTPGSMTSSLLFGGYGHLTSSNPDVISLIQPLARVFDRYLSGNSNSVETEFVKKYLINSQYVDNLSVDETYMEKLKPISLNQITQLTFYSSLENINLE